MWNSAFSIALESSQASQTYIVYSCLFPFVRLKFAVDGFCISYLWVFDVLNLNSNYVHASLLIQFYITYFMCINKWLDSKEDFFDSSCWGREILAVRGIDGHGCYDSLGEVKVSNLQAGWITDTHIYIYIIYVLVNQRTYIFCIRRNPFRSHLAHKSAILLDKLSMTSPRNTTMQECRNANECEARDCVHVSDNARLQLQRSCISKDKLSQVLMCFDKGCFETSCLDYHGTRNCLHNSCGPQGVGRLDHLELLFPLLCEMLRIWTAYLSIL